MYFLGLSDLILRVQDQGIKDFQEVNDSVLDTLNPLKIAGSGKADQLATPGGFFTELLAYLFPLALILLTIMTVWGGFEILAEASTKKSIESGKQRLKSAIYGFVILFVSYWIVRVLEEVFGIKIFL